MHSFPLIDALWASLDEERPSGDDPKRVASALHRFFVDLRANLERSREHRWKTELFLKLEPQVRRDVTDLLQLAEELSQSLPTRDPEALERLRSLDTSLRKATFELAQEEAAYQLAPHPSPKLNQFNYLFRGWERGLLERDPIEKFSGEYLRQVQTTRREIESTVQQISPRESEREKTAIENAVQQLTELASTLQAFRQTLSLGPSSCTSIVERLLESGRDLGRTFDVLEQCAPLEDPCPFCGGQISLSGRCRSCSRRLPRLEESSSDGEAVPQSSFETQNCRDVVQALLLWEAEPENQSLWLEFQKAVRTFAAQATKGHKDAEMLAMAPDRPIDSQSEPRRQEEKLKEVGQAFQTALTTLSRFSDHATPPASPLGDQWREPLREAEAILRELQTALQPEEE